MAQRVKNLPALQETQVQSLGGEDPLEEGMAVHSSILAWRIPMDRGAPGLSALPGSRRVPSHIGDPREHNRDRPPTHSERNLDLCITFTFQFHALEKEMATHSSILGLPWWLRW